MWWFLACQRLACNKVLKYVIILTIFALWCQIWVNPFLLALGVKLANYELPFQVLYPPKKLLKGENKGGNLLGKLSRLFWSYFPYSQMGREKRPTISVVVLPMSHDHTNQSGLVTWKHHPIRTVWKFNHAVWKICLRNYTYWNFLYILENISTTLQIPVKYSNVCRR